MADNSLLRWNKKEIIRSGLTPQSRGRGRTKHSSLVSKEMSLICLTCWLSNLSPDHHQHLPYQPQRYPGNTLSFMAKRTEG